MKRKRKKKMQNKLIKVIMYLVILIIIFTLAPNYEKNDNYYIEEKINLIIDNNNVTRDLNYDLFITEKDIIYISILDAKEYFDSSIIYDKDNNQIITTYGEKIAKLPIDKNIIKINDRDLDVLSGAIEKDGIVYIPLNSMQKVYELDIEYIKEEKTLLLDSLTKKLVKADVSKNCKVKYKTTAFSRTVGKLEKADKVIVIEHLENNWTKIRTKNGKLGYVKTNVLQNEIHIRDDLNI